MTEYSKSALRSNLGRVRGLGAARSGAHHWWLERVSALALLPLTIWFLVELVGNLIGATREQVAAWISSPVTALLLAALTAVSFWHTRMGLRVLIEDYVHTEWKKLSALLAIDILAYGALASTLAAIARMHFIGI